MNALVALVLELFSLVCMCKFVAPCINDAAKAAEDKDQAAVRDYSLMAGIGFLVYWLAFWIF